MTNKKLTKEELKEIENEISRVKKDIKAFESKTPKKFLCIYKTQDLWDRLKIVEKQIQSLQSTAI